MQGTESISQRGQLSQEQKQRRVVLKRTNLDRAGVRSDFLQAGTMAKGAAETGAVESYMCSKVRGVGGGIGAGGRHLYIPCLKKWGGVGGCKEEWNT